jgi:hypothetical protein
MQSSVLACYWKDRRSFGQACPDLVAAIDFLRRGSETADFVVDRIILCDGTLLMSRASLERLQLLPARTPAPPSTAHL